MALTAYQTQFKRRMKRAIRLRAKADQKARRYTQLLADAIGAAEDAATRMNELNQLYNLDVSTWTLLTQVCILEPGMGTTALCSGNWKRAGGGWHRRVAGPGGCPGAVCRLL